MINLTVIISNGHALSFRYMCDTISRFKELDNDGRRPARGRKCIVNTLRNRKVIEKPVQRNPRVSMRQIARDMGISDRSVKRIAKTELELKPYKLRKVQLLTEKKMNSYSSEDVKNF
ncbi:paired domain-containing protein [Trichonephila clavipes]|nr:paired domain-containing protein [Trichonephila clavipes]